MQSSRRVFQHARCLSTSARTSEQVLPDAKLRLLISLHHQARHFITPENLDVAIVRAFTPEPTSHSYTIDRRSMRTMYSKMYHSKNKLMDGNEGDVSGSVFESGGLSTRANKISSALFGTEFMPKESGLAGLEVVREETEAAKKFDDASSSPKQQF